MKMRMALVLCAASVLPVPAALAAGAPSIAFDPSPWSFDAVDFGTTASKTFTLTNSGSSATGALALSVGGSGAAQFTVTGDGCSATSLGPRKSCQVTVEYTPSAAGASDSATLTAVGKKADASASVSLSGAGKAPFSAPTDILLSNTSVDENVAGAVIGTLTAIDPDVGDVSTFTLSDNRFEVDLAGTLKLKAGISLDYETEPQVSLFVMATDLEGLSDTKLFIIDVNDVSE